MNSIFHLRRRGRRAGVSASLAATAAMLVASFGVAPAQGATSTAWVPLHCSIGGFIPVHFGAALTATFPESVAPGQGFSLTGVTTELIFGRNVQAGGGVFNADSIQGIITDFQVNLTNASVNFSTTTGGNPVQTSPTQFNSVLAVQPPNQAATGNPRINGNDTTRGGFQPSTPSESFSFGDVPVDISGSTGNRYGPVPGIGGGPNPSDGTPDALPPIGPITVTGAAGDTVVIRNANPGGPPVMSIDSQNIEPRIATTTIAYHEAGSGNPGTYGTQLPMDCAIDTTRFAVPKPVAEWVDQIVIPIDGEDLDGDGAASARGAGPSNLGDAQFSAITNCDETQNTRPFIVRWTEGSTTHTFRRTATDTSTCTNDGSNVNNGIGSGTVDGSTPATLSWSFTDSPDVVGIEITPQGGDTLTIDAAPPATLNGSPGGVWTFPTDAWPATGGGV